MSFQPSVGHKMKFYRNSGTIATPVWTEICSIGDLNISELSRGLAELKRRCNNYAKNLPALINSITVNFKLIFGLDSTNYTFLRTKFFTGDAVQYAIMNDAIDEDESEGLKLPALVSQFPWNQPLESVSDHDVNLVTAYMLNDDASAEVDPAWLVVST